MQSQVPKRKSSKRPVPATTKEFLRKTVQELKSLWFEDAKSADLNEKVGLVLGIPTRQVKSISEGKPTRLMLNRIRKASSDYQKSDKDFNCLHGWKVPVWRLHEFKNQTVPELVQHCEMGITGKSEKGYQLLNCDYNSMTIFLKKWASVKTLSMLHANGGLFRTSRLTRQIQKHKRSLPKDFVWPNQSKVETDDQAWSRLRAELGDEGVAEELGVGLEELEVFIPSARCFAKWTLTAGEPNAEKPEHYRWFWSEYLNRLNVTSQAQIASGLRKKNLSISLHEVEELDFIGHYFDATEPGGYISGVHLVAGLPLSRAFKVEWPRSELQPEDYKLFLRSLDQMRNQAVEIVRDRPWSSVPNPC